MASPQKKRFTFFGSPPMSPILSPTKSFSNYFSSEKQDEKLPNADEVRKAIDNLERLVVAAEAYRDLLNKLNKSSKTFSKALKDYGNSKGMENVHVMCLQTTSQFYYNHSEIQSKLNKALQKDFEAIQKFWDKYSKKVAKNEKTHNDYVGGLDKQLKKLSKDYEKKTKKDKASLESHNQYMNSITTIGSDIARAQKEYSEKVAKREKRMHSIISQIVCKIAEGQFAYFNDSLKKCGPSITKMKEWAPFAGEDMPQPQDLDVFLEDQSSQSQSDRNSTNSERKTVSVASISSISEKQIAAMNFSSQPYSEEPQNIISTKYVQMPEPKLPVITTPETTKPTNEMNINNNKKNDENTNSSTPLTPIVKPTSVLSFYSASPSPSPSPSPTPSPTPSPKPTPKPTQPSNSKTSDIISRFSIGIREDDNPFLRDEKPVEIHHPKVFMEKKAEKGLSNQNFRDQSKNQEEGVGKTNNITHDNKKNNENEKKIGEKKDSEKKDNEKKDSEKKDSEKKVGEKKDSEKNENQSENKGDVSTLVLPPLDNIVHDRDNVSDDSNTTLNDEKKNNEKSNGEIKINEKKETEKEIPPPDKSNENDGTISETINKPIIKDEEKEKEITNEMKSSFDKNLKPRSNINDDNKSKNQISSSIPSENPNFEHRKEIISLYNSQKQFDDYKKESSRRYEEHNEYEIDQGSYNDDINRYINREIIHRDEGLFYDSSVRGEKLRYNDYHRPQQQYIDDDYVSYDYVPSQNHGSYVINDRSPPRSSLPYIQRPYNNNIPIRSNRTSSVREMTNRYQSMNDERRPVTTSARNTPMPVPGRVSEMTSRFGERRNTRDEVINRNYAYDDYRTDRYLQYDDHDGITPVHHCNCHNCQMAIENPIGVPSRHSFDPRTEPNFIRKNYN